MSRRLPSGDSINSRGRLVGATAPGQGRHQTRPWLNGRIFCLFSAVLCLAFGLGHGRTSTGAATGALDREKVGGLIVVDVFHWAALIVTVTAINYYHSDEKKQGVNTLCLTGIYDGVLTDTGISTSWLIG